jgi:hypothetical protein
MTSESQNVSTAGPHNTLTAQEREAGWQLLFDGQDASRHWRGFRKPDLPAGWRTVDGTLHRAERAGDIITRATFTSFELSLQWKVEGVGNSGIFFGVSEEADEIWQSGPEMQVLNDDANPKIGPKQYCGGNYDLHPPKVRAARPVGQWNSVRIIVSGRQVELWLNDQQTVSYELGSEDWEQRVAASKFKKFPLYGRVTDGHLALQDHGDPVWYRDIKVRPL